MSLHACPCGCGALVPTHKLACRTGWYRLPLNLRAAVTAGYRTGPRSGQHLAAIGDALDWYRANPKPEPAQPGSTDA